MRAKTVADLLSLSVNLYLLSKDEDFLKELHAIAAKGKQKTEELYDALTGTENGEEMIEDFIGQIAAAKKRLEAKADEIAKVIYEKMHIAHTGEIAQLTDEMNALKAAIERIEARLNDMQQKNA